MSSLNNTLNQAFNQDDYCQRNDLLRNPEISEIFGLKISAKRTVGEKPENLAGSKIEPCSMHDTRAEFAPDILREKAKIIKVGPVENSDTNLNTSAPEVVSGIDRHVSHGYKAPTGNSTSERGNS